MQLIATETKSGAQLVADEFSEGTLLLFASGFMSPEFKKEHGEPNIELSDYAKGLMRVSQVRTQIDHAAEPLTREGVISDVAAVLVVGLASVVKAISAGKDLAEVKGAVAGLQPFADAVLGSLVTPADMKDPAAAIAAGKVIMPYMVKGDAAKVVKDMGQLANGVSAALINARKAA